MLGRIGQAVQDLNSGYEIAGQRGFAALIREAETMLNVLQSATNTGVSRDEVHGGRI
jgi:hypothetical protein